MDAGLDGCEAALAERRPPGEDGALVRPVAETTRGARLVARLRDQADGGLSADAVLGLTRGE
jgi:hypothetical protein